MSKQIDNFLYCLLQFMSCLHGCHKCKHLIQQINGRGKQRTSCDKYKQQIQRVRWYCIDSFPGFNTAELKEIEKQYKAGKCTLVLDGLTI